MWLKFFQDARIPPHIATKYALTFDEHRMRMDMLLDLNKECLRDLGVVAMGDIISILRHAKEVGEKTKYDCYEAERRNDASGLSSNPPACLPPTAEIDGYMAINAPPQPGSRNCSVTTQNIPLPSIGLGLTSILEEGRINETAVLDCPMGEVSPMMDPQKLGDDLSPKVKDSTKEARWTSTYSHVMDLEHSHGCRDAICQQRNCHKFKRIVNHAKTCPRRVIGGCAVCKQLIALCCLHAKKCLKPGCAVPYCANIKNKLKQQRLQQIDK
ncbi:uncharacterized protein LOC118435641 [Folsomia candida]|uniref:uncharacterized protein LOC118435641 n=1 Tax=Folsomia candida TaxID=158441 RepID=UPI00160514C9|nr:uncharacterized protein LOC118435641 [Folsomia candida]